MDCTRDIHRFKPPSNLLRRLHDSSTAVYHSEKPVLVFSKDGAVNGYRYLREYSVTVVVCAVDLLKRELGLMLLISFPIIDIIVFRFHLYITFIAVKLPVWPPATVLDPGLFGADFDGKII